MFGRDRNSGPRDGSWWWPPDPTVVAAAVLVLLVFLALAVASIGVWLGLRSYAEEAARPDPAPVAVAPEPAPDPSLAELPEGFVPAPISGLSVGDVTANLRHGPVGDWACSPPNPTEGGTLWTCVSPGGGAPTTHAVRVIGEDPLNVLSVEATVYGAEAGAAAEVLGHVASLCFDANDAANAEAWVEEAAGPGGRLAVASPEGRTILSLYGGDEERTLSVVGFDVPEEPPAFEVTVPEGTPEATNGG